MTVPFDTVDRAPSRSAVGSASRSAIRRGALVALSVAAVAGAFAIGDPAVVQRADPALANLLRGMAALKALLALAAFAVVWWRFGRATPVRAAAGYATGVAAMAAGAALIWQLSFIAQTAAVFHVAMLGLCLLALKDDGVARALPGRR